MNNISDVSYSIFDLEDEIHVWIININRPQRELQQYIKLLNDDELEKYNSFYFLKDKIQYLVSRGFIKDLLAIYLDVDSDVISIYNSRYGKPYLDESLNSYGIQFSIAHSNEVAVFAISRNRKVGIDIEFINKKKDYLKIASYFFTEKEKNKLEALSDQRRRDLFYQYWTRKEALFKAIGNEPPTNFHYVELSSKADKKLRVNKFKDVKNSLTRWITSPLFPLSEYVTTLAIEKKHVI